MSPFLAVGLPPQRKKKVMCSLTFCSVYRRERSIERPFRSTPHFGARSFLPEFDLAQGQREPDAGSGSGVLGHPFQLLRESRR